MAKLEEALSAIEARVAEAQKSADRLTRLLRRLAQAARTGNIAELNRGLDQVAQCGDEAAAAAGGADRSHAEAAATPARAALP
jgi:hypothetical protein